MICDKCKSKMIFKIENQTQCWYCQNCENAIATSYFSKIEEDETLYSVYLMKNNDLNIDNIKLISKLSGNNFIKSKELLNNGGILLSGLARDICNNINILKESNIEFIIKPDYKYL